MRTLFRSRQGEGIVGACMLALSVGTPALAVPPEREALWEEDIAAYAEGLERGHINLFHTVPREDFEARLAALRADLANLSEPEIVAALMHLTHSIGDGHTAMPLWNAGYHRYPIDLRWVDGEAIITHTTPDTQGLLGARITHWDGQPIIDVYDRLAPYAPFVENAGSEAVRTAAYLRLAELGYALGLSEEPNAVSITIDKNGESAVIALTAVDGDTYRSTVTEQIAYRTDIGDVADLIEAPGLKFALLADGELGYIQFDSYPSYDDMHGFADAISQAMRDAGTRNLAIDFRENYGGNFFAGLRLAERLVLLDQMDWENGVYVLTSGVTFSAAMSNTAQYADILNARIVGEPTGATPCGYQDMGQFNLPNSGLLVTYSKRQYCFDEPVEEAIAPDVEIAIEAADLQDGRDRAMDWILQDIATRSER